MSSAVGAEAMTTTAESLCCAADELRAAGIDTARHEAELLLAAAWETDRTGLHRRARDVVPASVAGVFLTMLQRRLAREPLQYILGTWEFWSVDLAVGPAVLIPRPETEILVERALAIATSMIAPNATAERPLRIADIGTGSGCIAIAVARQLPQAELWATDVSPAALAVARANAERNAVAACIRFEQADLCTGLPAAAFDVVVSNPPYVPTAEIGTLAPELAWEPRGALDGGADGLDVIRRLVPAAATVLRPGGWLLLEMAIDQGDGVLELLADGKWEEARVRNDLTGRPRVAEARRKAAEG